MCSCVSSMKAIAIVAMHCVKGALWPLLLIDHFLLYPMSQTARVGSGVKRRRPLLGKKLGPSAFVT